eukprot:1199950-Amphidinium_carterae.1
MRNNVKQMNRIGQIILLDWLLREILAVGSGSGVDAFCLIPSSVTTTLMLTLTARTMNTARGPSYRKVPQQ